MESMKDKSLSLLDVVLRFLEEEQWSYQKVENKPVIRAGYRGEHGTWICYIRYQEAEGSVLVHSLMGLNIPPEFRMPVEKYLTLANDVIPNGTFEMDMWTGDVRLKASVEIPPEGFTVEQIRALVYGNVRSMDHYFPGVITIVHGGIAPEAAFERMNPNPISYTGGLEFKRTS